MVSRDADVLRIFRELLDLPKGARRGALEAACGDDDSLRTRVQRLLAAEQLDDTIEFDEPEPADDDALEMDLTGRRVGRYRIIRRIGSGGMGTVYEAEQDEPRRRVALKTLKLGLDSEETLARFRFEAQVLARLDHPGVATVYEAGSHAGVPFFAMEFIEGARSVTQFAEQTVLDDDARIELFLGILEAVAYGHAQGIVHRDLKPLNILIDAEGRSKIIDFGVARAVETSPDASLLPTSSGELVGTLRYMSPEQLAGDSTLVGVQSDVYSLGVVLFELLADASPKDAEGLPLYEAASTLATSDPRRLSSYRADLPAELDWILARALETERQRRYRTANDFADDLRRFRDHVPVNAGPPSNVYRARKFVRRHRVGVAVAGLLLATLLAGLAGIWIALLRESAQRERLQRMTAFQASVFRTVRAEQLGPNARMADVLDFAAARAETEFVEDPLSLAELQRSFGDGYHSLGRFEDARQMYAAAHEAFEAELGDEHGLTAATRCLLASALSALGRPEEAVEIYEPLLASALERTGPRSLRTIHTSTLYAIALLAVKDVDRADELLESASAAYAAGLAEGRVYDANATVMLIDVRARLLQSMDRAEDALTLVRENEAHLVELLGEESPDLANVRLNHGLRLQWNDRLDEATPYLRAAYDVLRPKFGVEHPMVEFVSRNLAETIRLSGNDLEDSIPLYRDVIKAREKRGDPFFEVLRIKQNLASVYWRLKRFDESAAMFVEMIDGIEAGQSGRWFEWYVRLSYGRLLTELGRYDEAEVQLVRCRDVQEANAKHPDVKPERTVDAFVELYEATGRHEEAAALRSSSSP